MSIYVLMIQLANNGTSYALISVISQRVQRCEYSTGYIIVLYPDIPSLSQNLLFISIEYKYQDYKYPLYLWWGKEELQNIIWTIYIYIYWLSCKIYWYAFKYCLERECMRRGICDVDGGEVTKSSTCLIGLINI